MRHSASVACAALAVLALAVLALAAGPARAGTIFVSAMQLTNGYEVVDLNTGGGQIARGIYAGQQDLTANTGNSASGGAPFHLYAWCVDFYHDINIGSDQIVYTLGGLPSVNGAPPGGLTAAQGAEIAWLAAYGNAALAHGANAELSAAVQIDIWNVEYGFTYAGTDSVLLRDIASLPTLYAAAGPAARPAGLTALLSSGPQQFQNLVTFIPEPLSAALLAGGVVGLGVLRRRRRG